MPNAAPHVCACGGRPLVRTCMRCTDRTLRMAVGIPIALGRSQAAARLDQPRSRPGCNALGPRDEPLFMDLWTWSLRLREAARGSGVQRPAPHHSERVPHPLKPHAPSSPHLLSTMRAAAHTRHSGNAAHVRAAGALSCEARVPPPGSACSRRLCPAVRWSDRAHAAARGNPDESVAADASGASHGARRAHARERCGACWFSAQRAPEPAYARVT
jgi:hypothetical protein